MKARRPLLFAFATLVSSALALAQGLDPAQILKPLSDSWPTYSGDYSGKRYSSLTAINQSNVKNLTLAWLTRVSAGPANSGNVQTTAGGKGPASSPEARPSRARFCK